MVYSSSDLTESARKIKAGLSRRQNNRYHLARQLGFSSYEAIVLQSKPEETIKRLAKERDEQEALGGKSAG